MSMAICEITYSCHQCKDCKRYSKEEIVDHVHDDHGLNIKGKKATKELVLHVAREPRHISIYELKFNNGCSIYEHHE